MNKQVVLRLLAKKRQKYPEKYFYPIRKYANGRFECDHVSPYTKSACNYVADVFVMLQDWASEDWLQNKRNEQFYDELEQLGMCRSLKTNKLLISLLQEVFGLKLSDTYATNLFPFVKRGKMNARIYREALEHAARVFGRVQLRVIKPQIVICLGHDTFNALRVTFGKRPIQDFQKALIADFKYHGTLICCQAHTGHYGQLNTPPEQQKKNWEAMKERLIKENA